MGQALIEGLAGHPGLALAAAFDVPGAPSIGRDVGVVVGDDVDAALAAADVLIDFTRPAGTLAHLAPCARHGEAAVVGTTGLDVAQKAALRDAGTRIPIVFAANMSVGVNVMLSLVSQAARARSGLRHRDRRGCHQHKIGAPSGTSAALGRGGRRGRRPLARRSRRSTRCTAGTGERAQGAIGFATLRGGDVVGEHTVIFAAEGERIELTHRATSRRLFVAGALRAAGFVAARRAEGAAGVFDMPHVLGLA